MNKDAFLTGTALLLALSVVAGLLVRGQQTQSNAPATAQFVSGWEQLAQGTPLVDNIEADIVIVEFSDYTCGASAKLRDARAALLEVYPTRVRWLLRHHVLGGAEGPGFPYAVGSVCAAEQNESSDFHTTLADYALRDPSISPAEILVSAGEVDVLSFRACLEHERSRARIEDDHDVARELGIVSTPTLLINGYLYRGAPDASALIQAVEKTLSSVPN